VSGAAVRALRVTRLVDGAGGEVDDQVAVEEPLEVRVNGAPFAVIMRTPGQDVPLAAGFLLAEDVVRAADDIASIEQCDDVDAEARGNVLNVTVTGEAAERVAARLSERRQIITTAACGLCGRRTIESIRARVTSVGGAWTVPAAVVSRLPGALREAQARPSPAASTPRRLCDLDGRVRLAAGNVGRHNALDKIVGRALLEAGAARPRALVVSGRSSCGTRAKALLAGVRSWPGVGAVGPRRGSRARKTGITLCGFVRGRR
jgi:FdhD protein